ncbi:MAG: GntR family transcriptional regulator [Planctomycetota bacterium]|jgi:DNA-binding LacI/PurR family transcriptional regulator|nr:GntR family transcriptional regulator [Planctomycetota bacterium]
MPEPIFRDSPRSLAVRRLREWIHDGTLPDGSDLPAERVLAERLEVPRTTINRAVQILQTEGLIQQTAARRRVVCAPGSGSVLGATVLVIAHPLDDPAIELSPYLGEALTLGVVCALRSVGLRALVVDARETDAEQFEVLRQQRPSGVIVTAHTAPTRVNTTPYRALLDAFMADRVPVVLFGNELDNGYDHVVHDHRSGAAELVRFLHQRGCRRMVPHFIGTSDGSDWCRERHAGYMDAIAELGLTPEQPLLTPDFDDGLIDLASRIEDGAKRCLGFLLDRFGPNQANAPDAILALNDHALPILSASLEMLGRQAGGDVALAGYDGVWPKVRGAELRPEAAPVATVPIDFFSIGHALVQALVRRHEDRDLAPILDRVPAQLRFS